MTAPHFFSRIALRRAPAADSLAVDSVHRLLRDDAYAHHQLLWQFFPAERGSARDFLFRYVESERSFYTVSARPPMAPDAAWELRGPKPYNPQIEAGTTLHFDLRANPVVTHAREDKRKRDDVVMHAKKQIMQAHGVGHWGDVPAGAATPLYELAKEHGLQWLQAVGQRQGFSLLPERVEVGSYLRHRLHPGRSQSGKLGSIALSTLDFSGELTVTDSALFREALLKGVGHGKGFGCGLLLVRRV